MNVNVTLEEAYAEACRALGESIVREHLLTKALADVHDDSARIAENNPQEGAGA
jgi:hypothetical protein